MALIARQHWSAKRYAEAAGFVPALGAPVLALLGTVSRRANPRSRLRGRRIDRKDGAAVVAVDAALDMVAAARARRIDARVMDGHSLPFDSKFDAVFSNAALHWMRDQEAVLAGVHRALKSRRRFVAEMGGHNNTAAIVVALSAVLARRGLDAHQFSPWYFPSADAYRARLEAAGFTVEEIAIVPRPTPLPIDIEQWLDTFAEDFFGVITEPDRSRARAEVADLLRPVLMDETGTWIADYVRLRFRAVRAA